MQGHTDILIIGAGLAGIGTACHMVTKLPGMSLQIIEMRERMGGTWDLFRYPGIRSDSNMHVYGYEFRPWVDDKSISPGEHILDYIKATARDYNLNEKISFGWRVMSADFSTGAALWTVTLESSDGQTKQVTCRWLQSCAGYYSYGAGYRPDFPEEENFRGQIIHPQNWPANLDYQDKRVVVIGSGATAVTLVPSMAEQGAGHVTMLQRSPSYIFPDKDHDPLAQKLMKILPEKWAYRLIRKKNIFLERFKIGRALKYPEQTRELFEKKARELLPDDFDIAKHLRPSYPPATQRICFSPNGDLFTQIKAGKADIETGHIKRFTPDGIELEDGTHLPADIIVTATGLNIVMLGEAQFSVDGKAVHLPDHYIYKGCMLSNVPNAALSSGTLTASYTLRIELQARYICNILAKLQETGADYAVPALTDDQLTAMPRLPFMGEFNSGYVLRAIDASPRQGDKDPWINHQTYLENKALLLAPVDDGTLDFKSARSKILQAAQ